MPIEDFTHMDKLTQTQNAIDDLIRIMYSSLSYLTRKANFAQLSPDLPITQSIPDAETSEAFDASKRELVQDFVVKAKQLEYLITVLPTSSVASSTDMHALDGKTEAELEELQKDLETANAEYLAALDTAESLHKRLSDSLKAALEVRQTGPKT